MPISSNYNKTVITRPHVYYIKIKQVILEYEKLKCYKLNRMLSYLMKAKYLYYKFKLNKNEDKADKFKHIAYIKIIFKIKLKVVKKEAYYMKNLKHKTQ